MLNDPSSKKIIWVLFQHFELGLEVLHEFAPQFFVVYACQSIIRVYIKNYDPSILTSGAAQQKHGRRVTELLEAIRLEESE